jgi:phosphoribosylformylglycinamidine cyclo-ligase
MTQPMTYKDAGVDIEAGSLATSKIKQVVARTYNSRVLSEVGLFGGLFDISDLPEKQPVLVSSVDSVGTKTKVAVACGRFDTIGHDIVNHCANDILVQGARPLFFLDYVALGKLDPDQMTAIVTGVAEACIENDCVLIGGEMCEMPDVYSGGDIDLVGSVVGVVDKPKILDGSRVKAGDTLIGLASSGLHTNGWTLARKALYESAPERLNEVPEGLGITLAEALLAPHRSYLKHLWPLLEEDRIHAMAHITGGGIPDNLARVLPEGLCAEVRIDAWPRPVLFEMLAAATQASTEELYRTFNMGVGMIVCADTSIGPELVSRITESGCVAWEIGGIRECEPGGKPVELIG